MRLPSGASSASRWAKARAKSSLHNCQTGGLMVSGFFMHLACARTKMLMFWIVLLPLVTRGQIELIAASSNQTLSRTNLLRYPSASGSIEPVHTPADWRKRRASILAAMQEVMGKLPGQEKRCPLNATIRAETDCGTFIRRLVHYQS